MAINFKSFENLPEVKELNENSYILVNNNGVVSKMAADVISGGVPDGGTTGQVLTKTSDVDGEAEWKDIDALPNGGTEGQILTKTSDVDGEAEWRDPVKSVSSWNDLTDKPFDKTVNTLVDNVTVECTSMQGKAYGVIENVGFTIENDATYHIIFDNIEYTCVGYSLDTGSPIVGNGQIIVSGRENTGEPFALAIMSGGLMVLAETVGTHTITVVSGTIETIDPKCLPELIIDANNLPTKTQEWSVLYEKLQNAWKSGTRIRLNIGDKEYPTYLDCISIYGEYSLFVHATVDGLMVYRLTTYVSDGGTLKRFTIPMTGEEA